MSQEEELDLTPSKPTNKKQNQKIKKPEQQEKSEDGLKAIFTGKSDLELLDILATAPTESLIPWEEVELPSRGLYYDWTSGIIKVRPWGATVDKILATDRLVQSGQAVNAIVNACCTFPGGFNSEELLVGDQWFLLYYLRGITHGPRYEFMSQCVACQQSNTYSVDLVELATTITYADPALGKEPFRISLPYLSELTGRDFWVSVRFLRVRDTQYISRLAKTRNKGVGGVRIKKLQREEPSDDIRLDDTLLNNLEHLVVDVMGSADRARIHSLFAGDKMHSTDLATIREWLRDNTPGIQTQVDVTCNECGREFPIALPITPGFFRRQDSRAV